MVTLVAPPVSSSLSRSIRGGTCRYVLAKPEERADLEHAIEITRYHVSGLQEFAARGLDFFGEMPHLLLHFVVDQQFASAGLVFASRYVAEEASKRIEAGRNAELRSLISTANGVTEFGALRGLLFEEVAHRDLQRGGNFDFRRLDASSGAAQPGIVIEAGLKRATFRTLEELGTLAAPGVYARPAAKNFGTVDAVLFPSAPSSPVMFLQMTLRTSHPIRALAVERLRDSLPAALRSRGVQFVFVVPEDVAGVFAAQPFYTSESTVSKSRPTDMPQHLLTLRLVATRQ